MDNKTKILEATIKVFNKKGLKFTMDDIASELSMSKKTIYTVFKDKETMFYQMIVSQPLRRLEEFFVFYQKAIRILTSDSYTY